MAPPDPAVMSETIARFMQLTQERALEEKISSFQSTITALQERHSQEIEALQVLTTNLKDRYKEEAKAMRAAITDLQDRHNEHDKKVSSFHDTVKSLSGIAKRAEADNTKLQDEIAELRVQLRQAEGSLMEAETSRARNQREQSRRPYEAPQIATQLQEPLQHQPQHAQFFEDKDEKKLPPHHEAEASLQFCSPSGHTHNRAQQQNKPLSRPYPRGIKRAHVDDAGEPPRRAMPASEASNSRGSEQPRRSRTHQMKKSNHTRAKDDEVADCEEQSRSHVEDRVAARRQEFVGFVKSTRREYEANNYGTNLRAFISRFIDGIQDPTLSRWFQESLKARFPEKVHTKRQVPKAGGRIVAPTRELTWKDIETLLQHTPWPPMAD